MDLYTNGCSYVAGHRDQDYSIINHKKWPLPWFTRSVWPTELSKHFDNYFNHAWPGSSSYRLVRTVSDFVANLSPEEYENWIFVLGFSHMGRIETINDRGIAVKVDSERFDTNYDHSSGNTEEEWFDLKQSITDTEKETLEYFQKYYILGRPRISFAFDYFNHISFITNFLDNKGIKYLYYTIDDFDEFKQPIFDGIKSTINTENKIISVLKPKDFLGINLKTYQDPCGHPSAEGHRLYAKYVLTEIKNRNWL